MLCIWFKRNDQGIQNGYDWYCCFLWLNASLARLLIHASFVIPFFFFSFLSWGKDYIKCRNSFKWSYMYGKLILIFSEVETTKSLDKNSSIVSKPKQLRLC